jgi:hypothetical protein
MRTTMVKDIGSMSFKATRIDHENDSGGNSEETTYEFDFTGDQFPFTVMDIDRMDNGDIRTLKIKLIGQQERLTFEDTLCSLFSK